jgi:hypothetical protein
MVRMRVFNQNERLFPDRNKDDGWEVGELLNFRNSSTGDLICDVKWPNGNITRGHFVRDMRKLKASELTSNKAGPWTSHGHVIDGVTVVGPGRPQVIRCGGPRLCKLCSVEAESIRNKKAKE